MYRNKPVIGKGYGMIEQHQARAPPRSPASIFQD
nr:MAG TPA: hypothetical protein [Caudoviricetes sp.]